MWKESSSIILVNPNILVLDLSKKLHMNLVSWHCGINPSYLGWRSRIGIAFSTNYKKSHFQAHRWVAHCQEQGVKRQTKHLMTVTNSESFESRVRLVKQNSRHLLTVPLFHEYDDDRLRHHTCWAARQAAWLQQPGHHLCNTIGILQLEPDLAKFIGGSKI